MKDALYARLVDLVAELCGEAQTVETAASDRIWFDRMAVGEAAGLRRAAQRLEEALLSRRSRKGGEER